MFWKTYKPIESEPQAVSIIEGSAGEPGRPKQFSILGYTGGILATGNYPNGIVIDLAGLDSTRRIVANLDHDKKQRVGHVTAIANDGKFLKLDGVLSAATPARTEVVASAQDGFEWQASVEAVPTKVENVKAGASVQVNGQAFVGPIEIARKSTLTGIAFVSMGADQGTSVHVAASATTETEPLTFAIWCELQSIEAESMTDKQKAFAQSSFKSQRNGEIEANFDFDSLQERYDQHLEQIDKAIADHPHIPFDKLEAIKAEAITALQNLRAHACEHEHTTTRFSVDLIPIAAELRLKLIRAERPTGPAIHASFKDNVMDQKVIEASLLHRVGRDELAVKIYGAQAVEMASKARITSLVDLSKTLLQASGQNVPHEGNRAIITAAVSYTNLSNILSNVTGRTLVQAYQETTANWRLLAAIKPAADFKPQKGIRPSSIENLEELGADGQIKHGKLKEEGNYAWDIDTFAKMIGVTRKDMVNDDLSFFDTLSPAFGTAAGRTLNDLFWRTWMIGAGSFWHASNNNYLTTGTALSIANLGKGVQAMRKQVDSKGNPVEMAPNTLCVPPELESTAGPIIRSAQIVGGSTAAPEANPMYGIVRNLVVEPRLSNTNYTNNSTAAWYLGAQTTAEAIIVGFLDGNQNPIVEMEKAAFDTLGMQMRVVFDFGVALADPKAAFKATGAA